MKIKKLPEIGTEYIKNDDTVLTYVGEGHWAEKNSPAFSKYKRVSSYPNIGEQLDMLWHDIDNGLIDAKDSVWYLKIKEIKENNIIIIQEEQ